MMNKKISVDLNSPSLYIEEDSRLHRLKRRMSYKLPLRLIKNFIINSKINANEVELLEIGVGSGYFAKFFKDIYQSSKYTGIEYDYRLIEVTKNLIPDIDLRQGNAEEFNLQKKYDILVSFQVIEHLYDPESFIINAYNHLKPNGLLIVTTPNLNSIAASLMGKKWHGYREDHVSLKTSKDWETLIKKNGFSCIYSGTTFFSGLPWLNKLPLGIINWFLLLSFGALPWSRGEAFVGAFKKN